MITTKYARFASLVCAGLLAGFLTSVLVLELSLRGFDGTVYTQVRLVELDSLDKLAVATLLPALIATAVLLRQTYRTDTRWLTVAALALLVLVLGLTLIVNLPINSDQLHWNAQAPPANWTDVRDRWQIAHAVRTTAAVLAFVVLALATPLPSTQSRARGTRTLTGGQRMTGRIMRG
ncbi:anthrone oxygenase family protein [Streptomyces sp. NPDC020898]|uniref:anthrone oxygenase family protein n=1 Tax=Streptomyces sp. NPDC020898 TaxID=3365101 RepID=UPI00379F3A99